MMNKETAIQNPALDYAPELIDGDTFEMKIGGTVYKVTTHFNAEGRQSVLEQFRDLLLRENCG